jgi:hypothetical protein
MGLPQRVIEFLEDNLLAFTRDEVAAAARELGIEGNIEVLSREVLEEGVRRAMEAVRGLRETFGELPYSETALGEHLRRGGWFTVSLWSAEPNMRGLLLGSVGLGDESARPKENSPFFVKDIEGRFPPALLFTARPGLPVVSLPNLVATRERVFFRDRGRKLEGTLKHLRALRPLFASLGLSDLEGAMEALAKLKDGEARTEGPYVLARGGEVYALRRRGILGDPRLDGAVLLGKKVSFTFPGEVEIAFKTGWDLESASLDWVRIYFGKERVLLDGRTSRISPLHRDPLISELQAVLTEKLEGLEQKGTLSPKMLALLRAIAEHEDPFGALATGRFSPYVTAEFFRDL